MDSALSHGSWAHSIEFDLSACDTTMRGPFFAIMNYLFEQLEIPPRIINYLYDHQYVTGSMQHQPGNLKYKAAFQQESGASDTSFGNTTRFGLLLLAMTQYYQLPFDAFIIIIGGDDVMITTTVDINPYVFEDIASDLFKMGLKPELKIHYGSPHSATFFSGRFLPVVTQRGVEICHCTNIGRAIAKNLVIRNKHKVGPYLAQVTEMRAQEWNHIPLLSTINNQLFKVVEDYKGRRVSKTEILREHFNLRKPLPYALTKNTITYQELAMIYCLSVNDLYQLETWLSKIDFTKILHHKHTFRDAGGYIIDHPILQHILKYDMASAQAIQE
jgi:hypothetical protein